MSDEQQQRIDLVAPSTCIVCGKKPPERDGAGCGWTYLCGSTPIGSMTCSIECTAVALRRHAYTGRVDEVAAGTDETLEAKKP